VRVVCVRVCVCVWGRGVLCVWCVASGALCVVCSVFVFVCVCVCVSVCVCVACVYTCLGVCDCVRRSVGHPRVPPQVVHERRLHPPGLGAQWLACGQPTAQEQSRLVAVLWQTERLRRRLSLVEGDGRAESEPDSCTLHDFVGLATASTHASNNSAGLAMARTHAAAVVKDSVGHAMAARAAVCGIFVAIGGRWQQPV
jgi:hypothetical protein